MSTETFSTRLTELLVRWRWRLLIVAAGLTLLCWKPATNLSFDRAIENMFAPDDPLLAPYRQLKRTFGGNEVAMAVYVDPQLFTHEGLARLTELREKLQAIAGVEDVLSLDTLMGESILDDGSAPARRFRELFQGYTHGADGQTVALVCMLTPEAEAETPRRETVRQLREAVVDLPQGRIAGEPVMVVDGFRFIEEDGRRLGFWTTGLLLLTIAVCFRSLRWVLVALAVVQFTLLLTKAMLVWSGLRLSMVSSMLTAIVTVIGVATVVHIIVRFRDARAAGKSPREALIATGGLLAVPIFWTCATDAFGFASLWHARVGPVKDFGTMMASGSLLALVSVLLLVPGLALCGRLDPDPKRAWGEGRLEGALRRMLALVRRRPRTLALAMAIAAGLVAAGSYRLDVETDFTKNFRASSDIVQSYQFVETNLGGAGVWDVILPAPERLDWNYLSRVLALEDELRAKVPGLTKAISIGDGVKAGAPVDLDKMGEGILRRSMVSGGLGLMRQRMPVFAAAIHGEDPQQPGQFYLRIMLRARERQSSEAKQAMILEVRAICHEAFPAENGQPEAQVTGFFVLLTNLIESMIRDQWVTFGIAAAGIGLMMLLAFRSLKLALVALVPNALPILILMGLMGWFDVKINMGAAMIAAVSLGLSVDSSIHYLTEFRRARKEGHSRDESLDIVQQSVGRAVVFSTLALIIGFTALIGSQFVPTIYFGALVSLSMLGGLIGNLLVLPLLLTLVIRD